MQCIFATDSARFFEYLEPNVTLVMVDLMMPDMDGIQIIRRLAEVQCEAKVVLMSGLGSRIRQSAQQLASSLGLSVVGHLGKPLNLLELEEVFDAAKLKPEKSPQPATSAIGITDDELKVAIERNQFVNHYQPLIDTSTGAVVGVEALVRWQHPLHGLIYPDTFISRAESLGLVDDLGWLVTRRSFRDIHLFADSQGVVPTISINVSVKSLQKLTFPDAFKALADEYSVPPQHITLEVTESGLVGNLSDTLDVLTRLRMKQVELSIDDFGTGYSMMDQLRTVPATELKIDKSFVQNTDRRDGDRDRSLVKRSIEIGHDLGMRVVAEGVETVGQFEFLRGLGCDLVQGYLFSRAQPTGELVEWLQNFRSAPLSAISGFARR